MKKLLTLTGAALVLSSSFAMASNDGSNKSTFQKLDANADGVITELETNSRVSKRFTQLDLNNDGAVTKAEFNEFTYKRLNHEGRNAKNS